MVTPRLVSFDIIHYLVVCFTKRQGAFNWPQWGYKNGNYRIVNHLDWIQYLCLLIQYPSTNISNSGLANCICTVRQLNILYAPLITTVTAVLVCHYCSVHCIDCILVFSYSSMRCNVRYKVSMYIVSTLYVRLVYSSQYMSSYCNSTALRSKFYTGCDAWRYVQC